MRWRLVAASGAVALATVGGSTAWAFAGRQAPPAVSGTPGTPCWSAWVAYVDDNTFSRATPADVNAVVARCETLEAFNVAYRALDPHNVTDAQVAAVDVWGKQVGLRS